MGHGSKKQIGLKKQLATLRIDISDSKIKGFKIKK
jgi:hypothetical protein